MDTEPLVGSSVGHYQIVRSIGSGGMGVVYEAEDQRLGRRVAVKVLSGKSQRAPEVLQRFKREARAASALNHPGICTIHAIEQHEGQHFIVMELVEGETLGKRIGQQSFEVSELLEIAVQLADALESAHGKGIVHRDLKPPNIMLTPRGQPKILDFGLAKMEARLTMSEDGSSASRAETLAGPKQLTQVGSVMGTVSYMSPEQAQGKLLDSRTDLFSLGAVLYQMATGSRPFEGDTQAVVFDAILNREPQPLAEANPAMPVDLERILEKALEKERALRYQSAADLKTDLLRLKRTLDSGERSAGMLSDSKPASEEETVRSIAVLPFKNLSRSEDAEPFVAGLHDDLLTELSRIPTLTVIARTSVLPYRESEKSIREIARELGVGTLLEGAVQTSSSRLRLNVQLIDARTSAHLWAERYDRELSTESIFDIQSELVEKIAESLRAKLSPREKGPSEARATNDLEAYRLYAQGRQLLYKRTEAPLRQAVEFFEKALRRDPDYALAFARLADAFSLLHDYGFAAAERVLPQAEAAARRALELDPNLAAAHASLGLLYSSRHEGPEAVRELQRAIQLAPSYADAFNWLNWTCQCLGRLEHALQYAKRSVELDPLLPEALSNLAVSHLANGDTEEAVREAKRLQEFEPGWSSGPFVEALAQYRLGQFEDAAALLRDLSVPWIGSGVEGALALSLLRSGDMEGVEDLTTQFEEAADHFSLGMIHAARGEPNRAFEAFGRVQNWDDYWPTLGVRFYFPDVIDPLREDPRFEEILAALDRSWGVEPGDDEVFDA